MGLRHSLRIKPLIRYGAALAAACLGLGVHLGLDALSGANLSPYITFYPVVVLVALFAGLWPGLVAVAASAFLADWLLIPPIGGFRIESPTEALSLALFLANSLLLCLVAEYLRRARLKAAAYDREQALRETTRQKEFLAMVLERSSQPFAIGYPNGRLGLFNPAFEQLTGYTAAELHALDWSQALTPPEWREPERRKLEELARTGEPIRYEKEYLRKDGRRVPIELLVHLARDEQGELEYYYSFLTDITGRKEAEETLRKLNVELEQRVAEQTAQIRQANEALEQRVRERTAELEAAKEALQTSRNATLSLLEDALEARKATEEANTRLQAAVESLDASRQAAVNLMEDALQARKHAESVSAELRENQQRLLRLNRVLNALKDSSLAMMRSTSEAAYLADVCRVVVEDCGHAMVWVGLAEDDGEKSVCPAAFSGFEAGYLETLSITWADTDRGRGPTGTAIRTGHPAICRDTLNDPALAPWRAEAVKRGYGSSVAVPLLAGVGDASPGPPGSPEADASARHACPKAFGAITIYAKEPNAFSEEDLKLLTQLADDVSYCLQALRLRVAKAQADLERDKFISLADNSTVFIAMCGRDFIPFYVNQAGLRLVGLASLGQASRTPLSEFLFPEDRRHIIEAFLPSALRSGRGEVEVRFRHFKTGKPLWMLFNVFHIKDVASQPIGLGMVCRDITERRQAEGRTELLAETASQLLASDSPQLVVEDLCHKVLGFLDCQVFFNYLVDAQAGVFAPPGPAAPDHEGSADISVRGSAEPTVVDANADARPESSALPSRSDAARPPGGRTRRMHLNACAGISPEEAKRIERLDFGSAICGCVARDAHRIVAEDIQHTDDPRAELVRSFGIQAYAAFPLIAQGRMIGTLSFGTRTRPHFTRVETSLMRAVADQVAIAMERQRAKAALLRSAEDLKRSNLDLEQFAYVASHDLQEPLRAVGGYVRLLERHLAKSLDERARALVQGAIEGALRMERLINDLLDYSRAGSRGRDFVPTDLEAVLRQALTNLQPRIAASQAVVTHEPLPKLAVDSTQLLQVFQNLISNAIKFRGEPPPAIHVGVSQQNGSWVFSVRDNGIGIDPEYFGKLFSLFQRLHNRKQYPGTGIGLAVCKRIIERHGGRIWVKSQPGQGATFYFSIPAGGV